MNGCQRCGSRNLTQDTHTSPTGWTLAILAVPLGFVGMAVYMPLAAIAGIMLVVGSCLYERRAKCRSCKWTWKT